LISDEISRNSAIFLPTFEQEGDVNCIKKQRTKKKKNSRQNELKMK